MRSSLKRSLALPRRSAFAFHFENARHRAPAAPRHRLRRAIRVRGRRGVDVVADHAAAVLRHVPAAAHGRTGAGAGSQRADRRRAVPRGGGRGGAGPRRGGPSPERAAATREAREERRVQGAGGTAGTDRKRGRCWRRVEPRRGELARAVPRGVPRQ